MSKSSGQLFTILRTLYETLPDVMRRRSLLLMVGLFAGACLETVTVALLAFFVPAVSNPESALASLAAHKPALWPAALFPQTIGGFLLSLGAVTCLLTVFKNAYLCLVSYWQARICSRISGYLGSLYIHGLMDMPYVWHLRQNSSMLVTIYGWRDRIGNDLLRTLMSMISDMLLLVLLSIMLVVSDPFSFLFALALCPFLFILVNRVVRPLIEKAGRKRQRLALLLNKDATSLIHGIKEVKLQGGVSILKDISGQLDEFASAQASVYTIQSLISPLFETIGILMLTAIICLTYNLVSSPMKIMGIVAMFTVVVWRGLPSISRITSGITLIREALPTLQTFFDHLGQFGQDGARPWPQGQAAPLPLRRSLGLRHVSFRYEQAAEDAVRGVSFTLEKGRTLGIIGASGAGKSTVVDMLIGLLEPGQGHVEVDGAPLTPELAVRWRRGVGYVSQSPYISDDTLLRNIAFGLPDEAIDREWAMTCCRMAHIDEFLSTLPNGLDSQIGERGACLSGGQRQRVAIARAFYKKPEVLIFDEATSALDMHRERDIQETVLNLHGKVSMIIIAHRLSTVEHCDHILWLENGVVKLCGPPETVLDAYRGTQ